MRDRLNELLNEKECLFGVLCRDPTLMDIELMAHAGYNIVWLDLEHTPKPVDEVIRLGRAISHLGMVSVVRIPELSRTHVQLLLDGGIEVIVLPDLRNADQARQFVQLGKYPPIGRRGFSSTTARAGFATGDDQEGLLRTANAATRLLVMFESDQAYEELDEILSVDGVDMVTFGGNDWAVGIDLFGAQAKEYLTPKVERIFDAASKAGKMITVSVSSPDELNYYFKLGARIFFLGVDVTIKRKAITETLMRYKNP